MLNFSDISKKSLLGRIIRAPLKLLPKGAVMRIMQGSNKGFRWIKGSGVNAYWLGSYEVNKQRLISEFVCKDMICYDIGAHAGFYTLLFSRLSGSNGRVYAFEPNPFNMTFLSRHIEVNGITNVKIFPYALWDKLQEMYIRLCSAESKLCDDQKGDHKVHTRTLDELYLKSVLQKPDIIKIDTEGAELNILKGAKSLLNKIKPIIFIALDNKCTRKDVMALLEELGYSVFDFNKKRLNVENIAEYDEIIAIKEDLSLHE